jgi:recombinational DNA repair protein RecT
VSKVGANAVYEGDDFEYSYGFDIQLKHIPKGARGAGKEKLTHVYAYAVAPNGEKYLEVMDKEQIEEIRLRSDSGKKNVGPWFTDYPEMARKTVIRRLYKYLPKGKNHEAVSEAINLDEAEYPATLGQIGYIESLLTISTLDHDERASIERELSEMTHARASEVIEMLQENQQDPITSGRNYSTADITAKIQREIPLEP